MNRALRTLTLPLAAATVFGVSACGGNSTPAGGQDMSSMTKSTSSATASAQQNDADVQFATSMIPHHQQAVEMAEMALERASSREVKSLATEIKAAQDPEIKTMTEWLTAWGKPVPGQMPGHDMGSMDGMMTEQEMDDLRKATGRQFDEMWLTMMIKHHQGAVKMAETELAGGENPAAKKLAEDIIKAQNAEITEMNALLQARRG